MTAAQVRLVRDLRQGALLTAARHEKGWTITECVLRARVPRYMIVDTGHGIFRDTPTMLEHEEALCEALGVPMRVIKGRADRKRAGDGIPR